MKAQKAISLVLATLLLPHVAMAESWLSLEPSDYPAEVRQVLDQVRSACEEQGSEVAEDSQAGVTIIDLARDGSKDILLEAWRACSVQMKGFGACNTAGCDLKIFKQVGRNKWKSVFDEIVSPDWFLSASEKGYFRLLALSVSRKISDRCPDPDGTGCDYLIYWKRGHFIWDRIR
jgi:hypothetical protein